MAIKLRSINMNMRNIVIILYIYIDIDILILYIYIIFIYIYLYIRILQYHTDIHTRYCIRIGIRIRSYIFIYTLYLY